MTAARDAKGVKPGLTAAVAVPCVVVVTVIVADDCTVVVTNTVEVAELVTVEKMVSVTVGFVV